MQLEEEHGKAISELGAQLLALDRHLSHLESRQDVVMNEAKSAARSASYEATQGVVSDMARRIGLLEAAARPPSRKRISPDEKD